jgi:hypothetical protein
MLGLAGIGYFYLRLHDPAIPSMLLLHRESLAEAMIPQADHDYRSPYEIVAH